jgi:hypothetical protein
MENKRAGVTLALLIEVLIEDSISSLSSTDKLIIALPDQEKLTLSGYLFEICPDDDVHTRLEDLLHKQGVLEVNEGLKDVDATMVVEDALDYENLGSGLFFIHGDDEENEPDYVFVSLKTID